MKRSDQAFRKIKKARHDPSLDYDRSNATPIHLVEDTLNRVKAFCSSKEAAPDEVSTFLDRTTEPWARPPESPVSPTDGAGCLSVPPELDGQTTKLKK